jgi:hypothetical protein
LAPIQQRKAGTAAMTSTPAILSAVPPPTGSQIHMMDTAACTTEQACSRSLQNSRHTCGPPAPKATRNVTTHIRLASTPHLLPYSLQYDITGWRCPHRRLTLMRPFGNW